ncbi:MAG: tetratricopeptide repeat protein [Thermoguttaceae bacterium]|nr:tetratricopeptide repeat protein [Thermoguttaceae bacterium]
MEPRQERADDASQRPNKAAAGGTLRRTKSWAAQNRLRATMAVVAAIVSIFAVVGGGIWVAGTLRAEKAVSLDEVFEAIDSGSLTQAKELANELRNQNSASLDDIAGAVYALGVATALEADDTWSKDRQQKYLLAARYLEEARSRGFPAGRRGQGLYLLGKSLYEGGRIPASRPFLTEALRAAPVHREEIQRLLAGAYLEDSTPDLEKALHYNTLYLNGRKLAPAKHQEGLMQRAQILLAMGKPDECTATLQRIPAKSALRAEATILHGRVQMHQAAALKNQADPSPQQLEEARREYEEAIKTLQLAQGRDTLSNHATRKAMYLIGACFKEIGDYRAALRQFARTRQLFPESAEGMAASFEEAEISRDLGRDDDAVTGYRRAMKPLEDPRTFSNPWISISDLQLRMLGAYEYYVKTQNYAVALEIAKLLHPLFPEVRALELTAEVHRAWGEALLAEAEQHALGKAEPLLREGRRQLRDAGRIHARLADLLVTTRRYPELLWESGQDYMRGQCFTAAIGILKEYLKDQARRRHPQALVMLGEAYLAQGKVEEALEAFQECVDFHPRDAAAYQARLLASRARREKGEVAKAEKLLLENLAGEYLTPASQEWRQSLFDLGELLYQEGRYEDARIRLDEAVVRYPEDPRALTARYLVAESGRRAAADSQEQMQENLAGSAHLASSQKISRLYEQSLAEFIALRDTLSDWQQSRNLVETERVILRNACFAIGDIEFALGRYSQAVEAYSNATNRYQNAPEVLNAYVQIAAAYRQMGDSAQARSALEQAKAVLSRMKPDVAFTDATNFDRAQWSELLDYLSEL